MLFLWNLLTQGSKTVTNLDLQVVLHYGIPYTASILTFDPIQRLLAIGTLDGRIKIIGGDNIEGLLISPKKLPYKNLEFLHNRGFLLGVSNDNDIQVWNLECRQLVYSLQWETNITAFAVIHGTCLMYIGDENGLMSVLRYNSEEGKLLSLPYSIPARTIIESAGIPCPNYQSIVGILPQPSSSGTRVLIAYENGLLILWDVLEGHVVSVRGYTELQLKGEGSVDHQTEDGNELESTAVEYEEEKEICSLCWASNSGSILAVGYINGDILLWDISSDFSKKQQAGSSSKAVVKLQLASGSRRLPVIVLKWSPNAKADDRGGQLLIYGGDDMGSEEVLTVLDLEWSHGIDSLRCISRADLNLNGSFADMILIPSAGATEHNSAAALFVLTNPGQVNVYDGAMLPVLKSEDGKVHLQAEKFPVAVPTIDPCITVTKICLIQPDGDSSKKLLTKSAAKGYATTPTLSAGTRWPLTGGVPSESFIAIDNEAERIYISGYQDGCVRIWNATCPILKLMFLLEGKVPGTEVDGQSGSVSALEFCPTSMNLAVGNECGLVRIYKLRGSASESSFHVVSETKHEGDFFYHIHIISLNICTVTLKRILYIFFFFSFL
ncbi:syntaxin-binding protein 5-like isoform X2 [Asparagus officinalis]|uniref:syntaxin-binding protein 5-like isoform X2 n=1 Tax=Asparagus officinalis TaxID=4686 RepID=UPI00098E12F0|nr:syntaxin-binding protein 5-like isoform X2 [Asparagus officinalis]